MTSGGDQDGPGMPAERADPAAAERKPEEGAQDRAGFDLGGAVELPPGVGMGATVGHHSTPDPTAGGLTERERAGRVPGASPGAQEEAVPQGSPLPTSGRDNKDDAGTF